MGVIEKENELISSRYLTNSLRIAIDKSVDKIIASNRELSQTITKYSNTFCLLIFALFVILSMPYIIGLVNFLLMKL